MEFQIYNDEDEENLIRVIREFKKPYKTKVDGIYNQRTPAQNRYVHKIIGMFAKHKGLLPDDMKTELQERLALIEEKVVDDKLIKIVESTAYMDTLRLETFAEDIRRDAFEKEGLYLPLPNESVFEEYNEFNQKMIISNIQ